MYIFCKLRVKITATEFTTLHFIHNIQIDPISWSVTLRYAGNACQGQTPKLIGLIHKSQINWSLLNMVRGSRKPSFPE